MAEKQQQGLNVEEEGGSAAAGKVVCVTGASGYIASWIVKLLLDRGYTVHGTVRDTADPNKTLHLRALDGANDRLHLFNANLLEEGSFDAAIDGCECVFHAASPVFFAAKDPKAELLDSAVSGTLNVLRSCKNASVKRVVVTSSMAAVLFNGKPRTPDVVVDETWFSLPELCKKNQQWYILSKTLAEEAAWKFSKDNEQEIIVMNPTMVIGPLLQPTLNASVEVILNLINGGDLLSTSNKGNTLNLFCLWYSFFSSLLQNWKSTLMAYLCPTGSSPTCPNYAHGWVNVKDVALAHILAYEVPSAHGRYCIVERVAHYWELVKIISEMYPNIPLPNKCGDDEPLFPTYQVSKDKIRSLGMELIPLETSIKETMESFKEKGFVAFRV